jgi:hypothetical protein
MTADDIDTPDRDPRWAPSAINDSARALMGAEAQRRDRDAVRYSAQLTLSVQPGFRNLIDDAARRAGVKSTEWSRQALTEALKAAGIDPAQIAPRDAGALYDSVEGRQRYALVTTSGDILAMSYHDAKPEPGPADRGGVWLPVIHEDSEPFDIAAHWRLAPLVTVVDVYGRLDRVVVTYPVIPKSLEAM